MGINSKKASLSPVELSIICDKKTEMPGSGKYTDPVIAGTYLCRQCGHALFRAHSQFYSGCGWPSFDEAIAGAVKSIPDRDGIQTEIICNFCLAHLGHIFLGEQFTKNNICYCVNSISLDFVTDPTITQAAEAILAAGCFWGVEYYLKKLPGVLATTVGYTGGKISHPSYEAVCQGNTHHVEAVRVLYHPAQLTYEALLRYFFEIHDPTDESGQGPDKGKQYLSRIFYYHDAEKQTALAIIDKLKKLGYEIKTEIYPVTVFWEAEAYHQNYYQKNHKIPYCHGYKLD